MRAVFLTLTTSLLVLPAHAKYSGGSGTAQDHYQIATAADLIALGNEPNDYGKNFVLVADIDLDPNLPGRKVFDKAVIAPDTGPNDGFQGTPFTGVFDGDGHTISHLTITGKDHLGLFGQMDSGSEVKDLGVARVNIISSGTDVGGLVGMNLGSIATSYSTGTVSGNGSVGGLVGWHFGSGNMTRCYSTASVRGSYSVGGLVGRDYADISYCYSSGAVSGDSYVGGLVGSNGVGTVTRCFWDIQTSGQMWSSWGTGKTTAEMQNIQTYLSAGWDFVGEIENGIHEIWKMPEGGGYPVLAILSGYIPPQLQGLGTAEDPYLISNALDLGAMVHYSPYAHYRLVTPIDLSQVRWSVAVIPSFAGTFDGNNLTISHLTITGKDHVGLFGELESGAEVRNLGVVEVNVSGSGDYIGALAGQSGGYMAQCYSSGVIHGKQNVGGLAGYSGGSLTRCYGTGTVSGNGSVGGLVGRNGGAATDCYSTGAVSGNSFVGGLVGGNSGDVTHCYSTGVVNGTGQWFSYVGGLVGNDWGSVWHSVWDMTTSGLSTSAGGVGLTTAEMRGPYMLGLNGFAGDPNWVLDAGRDYPRLSWEGTPGDIIPEPRIDGLEGNGTAKEPYRIDTAQQLISLGRASVVCGRHLVLGADIDLDPNLPGRELLRGCVIPAFRGVLDGRGHRILHLTIVGSGRLGLFGQLQSGAEVRNLGVVEVSIGGSGFRVGALAGENRRASLTDCHSTGAVGGDSWVGGLVGYNYAGTIATSHSEGLVRGAGIGGLVGYNIHGTIDTSYSTATVAGNVALMVGPSGGLVGTNERGTVTNCHSTGMVTGAYSVGGLAGENVGDVIQCYSTGLAKGTQWTVGGLVGDNGYGSSVTQCYATGAASATGHEVGGLAGSNTGTITNSYATGSATGDSSVGGLIGRNGYSSGTRAGNTPGIISDCYSRGAVSGRRETGGLVGYYAHGSVTQCFWDVQTSGQAFSVAGTGKTTAEMQTAKTFLDAGWDFMGETANGTEDIWWILEGKDYPRLRGESTGTSPPEPPTEGKVIELPAATFDQILLGSDFPGRIVCRRVQEQ